MPARRKRQVKAPPGKVDMEEELSAPRTSGKTTRSHREPVDVKVFKESPRQKLGPAENTEGSKRQLRSRKGKAQPPEDPACCQQPLQSSVQDEELGIGAESVRTPTQAPGQSKPAKPRRVLWALDVKPEEDQVGSRDPVKSKRGSSVSLPPKRKREDGSPTRMRRLRTSTRAQDPAEKPPLKRQRAAPQERCEPPEPLGVKKRRGALAESTEDMPSEDMKTKNRGRRAPGATSPGKEMSLRSRLPNKASSAEQTPEGLLTVDKVKTKRSGKKPVTASPEAESQTPEDGARSSASGDTVRERRTRQRPGRQGKAPLPSAAGETSVETHVKTREERGAQRAASTHGLRVEEDPKVRQDRGPVSPSPRHCLGPGQLLPRFSEAQKGWWIQFTPYRIPEPVGLGGASRSPPAHSIPPDSRSPLELGTPQGAESLDPGSIRPSRVLPATVSDAAESSQLQSQTQQSPPSYSLRPSRVLPATVSDPAESSQLQSQTQQSPPSYSLRPSRVLPATVSDPAESSQLQSQTQQSPPSYSLRPSRVLPATVSDPAESSQLQSQTQQSPPSYSLRPSRVLPATVSDPAESSQLQSQTQQSPPSYSLRPSRVLPATVSDPAESSQLQSQTQQSPPRPGRVLPATVSDSESPPSYSLRPYGVLPATVSDPTESSQLQSQTLQSPPSYSIRLCEGQTRAPMVTTEGETWERTSVASVGLPTTQKQDGRMCGPDHVTAVLSGPQYWHM
ncbi:Antigen KI-67 [Myotis davidii]|uniref:Antigen KI-67 n=1 Tax=Myotis davidii TaxID=225400 RepID=L5MEV6_MYODS|nr:Antigen KI-67 [Myotis davidii]